MKTLKLADLAQTHIISGEIFRNRPEMAYFNTDIEFWGSGTYSLCDDGVCRKGRFSSIQFQVKACRLADKIIENRIREARRNKAEKVLRAVRLNIFDYYEGKEVKAHRVIQRCKTILKPRWEARAKAVEDRKLQRRVI